MTIELTHEQAAMLRVGTMKLRDESLIALGMMDKGENLACTEQAGHEALAAYDAKWCYLKVEHLARLVAATKMFAEGECGWDWLGLETRQAFEKASQILSIKRSVAKKAKRAEKLK